MYLRTSLALAVRVCQEVLYLENNKSYFHFAGGLLDCREYLANFLISNTIPFQSINPNAVRTPSGFFRIEEVDVQDELDKLRAGARSLEIACGLPLNWSHSYHLQNWRLHCVNK